MVKELINRRLSELGEVPDTRELVSVTEGK
jgi:hypothetical protein